MNSRRDWIRGTAVMSTLLVLKPLSALAATAQFETALSAIRGSRKLNEGRVDLSLPALAENGNSVGLTVGVAAPADAPVTQLWLLSPRNPEARIAHFRFGPLAVPDAIETRVRLSGTQELLAIAEFDDGSLWSTAAEVIVSVSACIDGLL